MGDVPLRFLPGRCKCSCLAGANPCRYEFRCMGPLLPQCVQAEWLRLKSSWEEYGAVGEPVGRESVDKLCKSEALA